MSRKQGLQNRLHLRLEPLEERQLLSTCHVTRLSDAGIGMGFRGDLRYCINKVNANPGADDIDFHVTGTINLTGPLPNISEDLAIVGPGADDLTVRRDTGGNYRVFTVDGGVNAQFYSLTASNGHSPSGGGILNNGSLILADMVVSFNIATGASSSAGGGVHNAGSLLAYNTVINGNTATNGIGGGILSTGSNAATLDLIGCTISNNTAGSAAGGVFSDGTTTIQGSTISGNTASSGGGVFTGGVASIFDTTISDNVAVSDGGGVLLGGPGDSLTIQNSTISGNTAQGFFGGGIRNLGQAILTILNSTISDNSADIGGGVHSSQFGVQNYFRNSIFAGNSADSFPDFKGPLNGSGHNLFGTSNGGTGQVSSDILDVDPMLGPLADNGGPTLTHALLPGSPAIDAADNTDAPEFDQRGPGFPRIVNGTIDIGAFEMQASPIPSGGWVGRPVQSAPSLDLPRSGFITQPRVAERTLGTRTNQTPTLKGLHHEATIQPLRGMSIVAISNPGCAARPWAVEFNPFGVSEDVVADLEMSA